MKQLNKGFILSTGIISIVCWLTNFCTVIVFGVSVSDTETALKIIESANNRIDLIIINGLGLAVVLIFIAHNIIYLKNSIIKKILWLLSLVFLQSFIAPFYWYFNVKNLTVTQYNKRIEVARDV